MKAPFPNEQGPPAPDGPKEAGPDPFAPPEQLWVFHRRAKRILFATLAIAGISQVTAELLHRLGGPDFGIARDACHLTAATFAVLPTTYFISKVFESRSIVWGFRIAAFCLVFSQVLNLSDEIAALDSVFLLGKESVLHTLILEGLYIIGLFMLFLMLCLSIIETSHARVRLGIERHELSREIAERQHAEEELRKGERKYRLIVENVSDIVWTMDMQGRFTFVSPSVERILGYTSEQFVSTQMSDLFTPQSYEEVLKELNDRLATDHERVGRPYHPKAREFELLHKDGPKVICECTSLFLRNETGEPTGVVGVARNITERRRAEQAIIRSSRMEATSTLAGGIAHDFNNLMTAVLGNAELLRSDFEDRPDVKGILTVIADSAKKAGELSQQMLAYAQGGKYVSKIGNLNETIRKVIRSEREKVIDRIEIGQDLEEDLWMVECDPAQMNQVVLALTTNAIESIDDTGRIHITSENVDIDHSLIEEHPFLRPGRHICISVTDTGCGMEKETLSRVFEPFFSTKFQGRGMGLAAAYGIIKNHEGYILASSHPGGGSTFSIYLPIVEVAVEEETPKEFVSAERGATILVVEDDEHVLEMTQAMLEHLGHRSLLARNGKEAVEVARTYKDDIDIAWLDLEMPVMDGAAALPLLLKARPNMKIVLCSGYDLDVTAQRLLVSGASSFVRKPFTTETLDREIQAALSSRLLRGPHDS